MDHVRQKMQAEAQLKEILERAKVYALEYTSNIQERKVFPSDQAIRDLDHFDEDLPHSSGDATEVLEQLRTYGSPATIAGTGGRYFGFVTGGALPVTIAAKWLADVWDQNAALYLMSPVSAKIETVTERWLTELFGVPRGVVASFLSGSSMAIFCGLAAARYRLLKNRGWDFNRRGHDGAPRLRVVAGESAHGAVTKAIALLGFGLDRVEWVACDGQGRLLVSALPALDQNTIVVLQAGHVSTGSFDPLATVCERAHRAGAWVHVDGAFGLWARASKKLRYLTRGMEKATSWSVDAHKTLNTPYDNGILLCADREALVGALQASGSYLAFSEQRDGMMYTPEMSRRARAVELWAALKYLGTEGVDELVTGLHERATQFGAELRAHDFEVLNEIVFNQVLVGYGEDDKQTQALVELIQRGGECWVGTAVWQGRTVIRISVCSWVTTPEDISRSARAFVQARDTLCSA